MIAYTEKGIGLWLALEEEGLVLHNVDGVFYTNPSNLQDTSRDAEVQAFVNAYDPVPYAQEQKIAAINAECRSRLIARYGPPEEQVSRGMGVYGVGERDAMQQGIASTIDASNAASNAVLAAQSVAGVEAVTVAWPEI